MALGTHEVTNQVAPLVGHNLYTSDRTLSAAVQREGAAWAEAELSRLGGLLGGEEAQRWGFDANENEPVLHTHDAAGNRRDEVEFHPSWHQLMRTSVESRIHSLPWVEARAGAHVARAALLMITAENELGHTCPISMTFSSVAALRGDADLAREWEPRIVAASYDPRFRPANEKTGILIGMGMTEKQGGSDVRANTTRAERIGNSREYLITGHKWFCSAPMCDAFLILAQAPKGLSCFFMPRWTAAGERNGFFIQRLKRKMGNRSNASSEVEFVNAWAQLVGEEGPRSADDYRNGASHAPRLRDCFGGIDAASGRSGGSLCAGAASVWETIDRATADAKCLGGFDCGVRSGDFADGAIGEGV